MHPVRTLTPMKHVIIVHLVVIIVEIAFTAHSVRQEPLVRLMHLRAHQLVLLAPVYSPPANHLPHKVTVLIHVVVIILYMPIMVALFTVQLVAQAR